MNVEQARLHLIGGLERGQIGVEEILGRHECDHLGAEIDDIEGGTVGRVGAGSGDGGGCVIKLNVGLLETLEGDRRGVHTGEIGRSTKDFTVILSRNTIRS